MTGAVASEQAQGTDELGLARPVLACPQCGGLLRVPSEARVLRCTWCGSTLAVPDGPRVSFAFEQPRLDRTAAEAAFRAWLHGPTFPRRAADDVEFVVEGPERFPFLRVVGPQGEVVPLAPLPQPDVLGLARVPAVLVPGEDPGDLSGAFDQGLAEEALRGAAVQPGVSELRIEERVYYSVHYRLDGRSYSAVIDGSAGSVAASRLPGRPFEAADRTAAFGVAAALFLEAWLLPGAPLKLGAIGLTAGLLRVAVPRLLDGRG